MGEAPHLLDPEALEEASPLEDGRQRGLYEAPCAGSGAGRSPASTAEFTDSILEVGCAGLVSPPVGLPCDRRPCMRWAASGGVCAPCAAHLPPTNALRATARPHLMGCSSAYMRQVLVSRALGS